MHGHKQLIEKYRYLIAIALIALLAYITYSTDQFGVQESMNGAIKEATREKSFDLKDRCGMMPTASQVSHTISGNESCENECRARCASEDLSYDQAMFEENLKGCNFCKCDCS